MFVIPDENETFLGRAAAKRRDIWIKERYR